MRYITLSEIEFLANIPHYERMDRLGSEFLISCDVPRTDEIGNT
ncbi:hypothetical protein N9B31_03835 [Mariniblastus sp.]|nr:hypothetical protein [Mariniblastus sp.]MDA7923840.1 hypothetical protein [Mariniblastus sp.]MDB4372996.1 hypothetical protein [Mariniblastus sp.]MDB4472970.1 hypothetical protein [bacterium]